MFLQILFRGLCDAVKTLLPFCYIVFLFNCVRNCADPFDFTGNRISRL